MVGTCCFFLMEFCSGQCTCSGLVMPTLPLRWPSEYDSNTELQCLQAPLPTDLSMVLKAGILISICLTSVSLFQLVLNWSGNKKEESFFIFSNCNIYPVYASYGLGATPLCVCSHGRKPLKREFMVLEVLLPTQEINKNPVAIYKASCFVAWEVWQRTSTVPTRCNSILADFIKTQIP